MTKSTWTPERERELFLAILASNDAVRYNLTTIGVLAGATRDSVNHKLRGIKKEVADMRAKRDSGYLPDTPTPRKRKVSVINREEEYDDDMVIIKEEECVRNDLPSRFYDGVMIASPSPSASPPKKQKQKQQRKAKKGKGKGCADDYDDGSEPPMPDLGSDSDGFDYKNHKDRNYKTKAYIDPEAPAKKLPPRKAVPERNVRTENQSAAAEAEQPVTEKQSVGVEAGQRTVGKQSYEMEDEGGLY